MTDELGVIFMGIFLLITGIPILLTCIWTWKGDKESE